MNKVPKDTFYKLYIEEQRPMHEISKMLGIAIGTVFNYLKKYSIQTRNKEETFNFKGGKQSDEAKLKISKIHKNKIVSLETKEKMSKSKKGKCRIKSKWGAHTKKRPDGYILVFNPDHIGSDKDGYILEHRLVMEKVLGRILDKTEVVHHINGVRDDNRPENLSVFKSISDHTKYHAYFRKINKERRNDLSIN